MLRSLFIAALRYSMITIIRMACILKERDDGTVKLRLIVDFLRSGINSLVRLSERIVLPRIVDMLQGALAIGRHSGLPPGRRQGPP